MARKGTKLQMDIVELLAQGLTRHEIAEQLGCSVGTVSDVRNDPDLKQKYYELCNQQVEQLVPLALKRLKEILENDKANGSVHVAAVREVLDRSHMKELLDATEKKIEVIVSYE